MESKGLSRLEERQAKAAAQFANNPLYRQPEWVAAHARLLHLLPNARESMPAPYNMVPDAILQAGTTAGVAIESILLYNPWRGNPEGRGSKSWEEYSKPELFDEGFAEHPAPHGKLWFIPDDCFGKREPYVVSGERLRDFVTACPCSLDHDVLFIWADVPRISIIHHEGAFFHLVMPTTPNS